ncbi:hypothetical protein EWB00_000460 [Schistosoma japonicum]|uniref:Uncharacterized protein n=1 Tax=Schistosoma japonicum TaxID=6182 RepID=A0A4Z2CKF4_SCHJA|nr:hypothetical protein EWB00_000460 [Schistosoma japonicum]
MSSTQRSADWFKKVFNLVIENEYKFFKARRDNEAANLATQELGIAVYLEDYLTSIYETTPTTRSSDKICWPFSTKSCCSATSGEQILKKAAKSHKLVDDVLVVRCQTALCQEENTASLGLILRSALQFRASQHIFGKHVPRSTFDRTQIFRRKKSNRKVDLSDPLFVPTIELNEAILQFLSQSISVLAADSDSTSAQSLFYISEILSKNLPEGVVIRLDVKVYKTLRAAAISAEASTLQRLGAIKLIKYCENSTEDSTIADIAAWLATQTPIQSLPPDKARRSRSPQDLRPPVPPGVRPCHQELQPANKVESDLMLWCQLAQLVLNSSKVTVAFVKTLTEKAVQLPQNQRQPHLHRRTLGSTQKDLADSVQRSKQPVTRFVQTNGTRHFRVCRHPTEERERLLMLLWSDIPEARMQVIRVLLSSASELQKDLLSIDNTEGRVCERERPLSEHQSSGDQLLLQQILSRRGRSLVPLPAGSHLLQNLDDAGTTGSHSSDSAEKALESEQVLRAQTAADPVDPDVKRIRVFDWIESTLGYSGKPGNHSSRASPPEALETSSKSSAKILERGVQSSIEGQTIGGVPDLREDAGSGGDADRPAVYRHRAQHPTRLLQTNCRVWKHHRTGEAEQDSETGTCGSDEPDRTRQLQGPPHEAFGEVGRADWYGARKHHACSERDLVPSTDRPNGHRQQQAIQGPKRLHLGLASSYSGDDIKTMDCQQANSHRSPERTRGVVNLTRLLALADMGENIVTKVANPVVMKDFLALWVDVADTAAHAVDALRARVNIVLEKIGKTSQKEALIKQTEIDEEDDEESEKADVEEPAAEQGEMVSAVERDIPGLYPADGGQIGGHETQNHPGGNPEQTGQQQGILEARNQGRVCPADRVSVPTSTRYDENHSQLPTRSWTHHQDTPDIASADCK